VHIRLYDICKSRHQTGLIIRYGNEFNETDESQSVEKAANADGAGPYQLATDLLAGH